MILCLDCRSVFLELLDFRGHMLSKELSHRVADDFTVTGTFPVFPNHVCIWK